jgi:hypothetical protein
MAHKEPHHPPNDRHVAHARPDIAWTPGKAASAHRGLNSPLPAARDSHLCTPRSPHREQRQHAGRPQQLSEGKSVWHLRLVNPLSAMEN